VDESASICNTGRRVSGPHMDDTPGREGLTFTRVMTLTPQRFIFVFAPPSPASSLHDQRPITDILIVFILLLLLLVIIILIIIITIIITDSSSPPPLIGPGPLHRHIVDGRQVLQRVPHLAGADVIAHY
jgi:hypothetical protein